MPRTRAAMLTYLGEVVYMLPTGAGTSTPMTTTPLEPDPTDPDVSPDGNPNQAPAEDPPTEDRPDVDPVSPGSSS